jgi:uncharacterized protein YbjT (DUF2867 family)
MARVLIAGCGCRGLALARALSSEHAVRGASRRPERVAELEEEGIESAVADPDRLATLVPALSGVSVVCWLMGTAEDSPELHGARLQTLVEHLVDTHVRGLVYEAGGTVDPDLLAHGAQIVRAASHTWHIRGEVVTADPADHEAWLGAMRGALERTLS